MSYFVFDGQNSRHFGLYTTGEGVYNAPERDVEFISVPGRSGDLIIDNGRYLNIKVDFDCFCAGRLTERFRKIKAWLLGGSAGYRRLEDSYDPEYYRMGMFAGPLNVEQTLQRVGECTITFSCKPFKYKKIGERMLTIVSPAYLENPENFDALPYVKLYGSGEKTLAVNGSQWTVDVDEYVEIDSEAMMTYKSTDAKSYTLSGVGYPVFRPGVNNIQTDADKIEIIPRWRTL